MAEISPLRRRMIEDMTIRNLSPATQRSYLHAVSKLSREQLRALPHFVLSPRATAKAGATQAGFIAQRQDECRLVNTVVIFVWCELFERRLGVRVATATMR